MNITSILQIAEEIGPQAVWPLLCISLLTYGLNQSLRYRSESQRLKNEKLRDRLAAIAAANALLKKLDRGGMSDAEFSSTRAAVLQLVGIKTETLDEKTSSVVLLPSNEIELYNKFNVQAAIVCAVMSLIYFPLLVIGFTTQGWHPSIHLDGFRFSKEFSKSTNAQFNTRYEACIIVFIILFIVIKIFCARSKPDIQVLLSIFILFIIYVIQIDAATPVEIYLP